MRSATAAALVAAAIFVGACGGGGGSSAGNAPAQTAGPSLIGATGQAGANGQTGATGGKGAKAPSGKGTGPNSVLYRSNYQTAFNACKTYAQLAETYAKVGNPKKTATAYAGKYNKLIQKPVYKGCFAGIKAGIAAK